MARAMKDSGVEWIRRIPEKWRIKRLKFIFVFGKGLPITKENLTENGIAVISYGQIHSKINTGISLNNALERYVSEEYLKTNSNSLVHKGDFIFADTSEDLEGCGNCVYVDYEKVLFAGYHTIILFNDSNEYNKYIAYQFQCDAWRKQLRSRVFGVKLFSITRRILNETTVLLPDASEQELIASFLDSKCQEIDNVLAKTRSSIEEYKKLKQAIITKAVTKGIRKNRKMKDSGIEWIGEIKACYSLIKLKYILREPMKYGASESGTPFDTSLPRYIRITDITSDGILKESGKLSLSEEQAQGYILESDAILFARSGATVGKSFLYELSMGRAAFAGYLISAIVNENDILIKYLYYYVNSSLYWEWCNRIFTQSTIQNIGADKYSNLLVVLPSLEEQQEIVSYLSSQCAEIDTLISKKEQLISELESYKKSLIYEYVTGKKEVPMA